MTPATGWEMPLRSKVERSRRSSQSAPPFSFFPARCRRLSSRAEILRTLLRFRSIRFLERPLPGRARWRGFAPGKGLETHPLRSSPSWGSRRQKRATALKIVAMSHYCHSVCFGHLALMLPLAPTSTAESGKIPVEYNRFSRVSRLLVDISTPLAPGVRNRNLLRCWNSSVRR